MAKDGADNHPVIGIPVFEEEEGEGQEDAGPPDNIGDNEIFIKRNDPVQPGFHGMQGTGDSIG
ncbi:hypothetical protein D3C81_2192870 [compost metagenome]